MKSIIYLNGIFHSMKSEEDTFYGMEVRKGKIYKIYKDKEDILESNKSNCKIVDLNNMHVYPCIIDSHTHMLLTIAQMSMGFKACEITKEGIFPNTISGIEKRIREYSKTTKEKDIIALSNYIQSAILEKRMPNKDELDLWTNNRAIVIYSIDGHSTALSTKMLKLVGIDPSTTDGILTGELNERTQGKIISVVGKKLGIREIAIGISRFHNYCMDYGINMVGALEGNSDSKKDSTTKLISILSRHFNVKVRLYLQYIDYSRVKRFERVLSKKRVGGCGDFEMDGSVGSHSASFDIPFKDSNTKSMCYFTQEEVDSITKKYNEKGYQIASHAIGSNAIHRYLEALSKLDYDKTKPFHRIEHVEFIKDKDLELLKDLNLSTVMQPGYSWIDKRYLHTYENYLDDSIIKEMKLKSIYEVSNLSGSSDSPVQDMDPYLQMLGMCDFYNEEESLTPYEAFKTYTINAAKCMLEDLDYGSLEEGKVADFFISNQDFFKLKSSEIVGFRPIKTYYNGNLVKPMKENVFELIKMMLKKGNKI